MTMAVSERARQLVDQRAVQTLGHPVNRAMPAEPVGGGDGAIAELRTICLADVQSRPVEWLWEHRLPVGKLVVLDGFPGGGKSSLMLDVAARLSKGWAMPDGSRLGFDPVESLLFSYEDDPADTIRPRLEAAGADLALVHVVDGVAYNGATETRPASLPTDLALVDQKLAEWPDVKLVVIDPLMAAVSADVDTHRDQDVRRVLSRLSRIAQERRVCIVIVRHLRKSHGGNAITAGGGSIGIIGQARVGLLVDRHPEEVDVAVLAVSMTNIGPIPPALMFRRSVAPVPYGEGAGELETVRIEWAGACAFSADELLAARENDQSVAKDASEWLREVLQQEAGRLERKELLKLGADSGFPERTLDRAARKIGVVKRQEGFGRAKRSYWTLNAANTGPLPPIPPHTSSGANDGNVGHVAGLAADSDAGLAV